MKTALTDARVSVYVQTAGTLSVMLLGIAASIALVMGAIWLVAQFVLLVVSALAMCFSQLGETWAAANSLTRLLMLASIAFAVYWMIARRKKPCAN